MPIRKALTMRDVMRLSPEERRKRGRAIGAPSKRNSTPEPQPEAKLDSRAMLKRWREAEKPIEIIG